MIREFTIPGGQKASDECPAIPRTVKVYAKNRKEAFEKLTVVLTVDPELKEPHPELTEGAGEFKERKEKETKKPTKKQSA